MPRNKLELQLKKAENDQKQTNTMATEFIVKIPCLLMKGGESS